LMKSSALQRAEIAEIAASDAVSRSGGGVSVLFNEPKLLKLPKSKDEALKLLGFSALQRAEIAEILNLDRKSNQRIDRFQCSSTSRNC